jgi:hypothetical protein
MDHLEFYDDPDLDNPYAPPKSAAAPQEHLPEISGIPFNASDIFNWSYSIFKSNMGICIGIVIGALLLNLGINFGLGLVLGAVGAAVEDKWVTLALNAATQLVGIIIQTWLTIGMTRGLLKIARSQPVSFDVVFSGGRYMVPVIVAGIVFALILALLLVPVGLVVGIVLWAQQDVVVSFGVGALAFAVGIVVMLYLFARLGQFFYLIIDRNTGALESIRMSWQLTEQRAGTIIVLYFLQAAIQIAGFLAVCVGLIFAIPLNSMISVVTYLALTGKVKAPESPITIWEEEL